MAVHLVPFRLLADLVRVGAAFGAVAALVGIPSFGMGARCLLVLLVLMVPRAMGGVPAPLDFAFGSTLLVAVWTSMAGWYETTPIVWLVHAVATGVTAVVVHRVLTAVRVLGKTGGRAAIVGRTLLVGLVVGGVWEAYRWFESIAVPALSTHVVADLAVHLLVDAAGALVAGLVVATLRGSARALTGPSPVATGDRVRPIPRPSFRTPSKPLKPVGLHVPISRVGVVHEVASRDPARLDEPTRTASRARPLGPGGPARPDRR